MSTGTVTISASMRVQNIIDRTMSSGNKPIVQSAEGLASYTIEVGFAAHQEIDLSMLTTPGIAYFENLDDTNYIEIGIEVAAAFQAIAKLKGNSSDNLKEIAMFRVASGVTLYAKANTAACILSINVAED